MTDPTLIVAAAGPLTAAIFVIGERLKNRKKNNPGSLHEIHLELRDINNRLKALDRIEAKLNEALSQRR